MNWFRKMMVGRYGMDQLSNAMLILSILLLAISSFTRLSVINALAMIILIPCYARIFSRNINKRREENMKFLQWWYPKNMKLTQFLNRVKAYKTYRYYKCPQCGQRLRAPKGKGRIRVTCLKCHKEFIKKS
ncbi:MAG: zinc ribbon domain-containing protein [Lutispora sp.]|nr:zinc ribbon domain-containing protein [Lutispora sp.]